MYIVVGSSESGGWELGFTLLKDAETVLEIMQRDENWNYYVWRIIKRTKD